MPGVDLNLDLPSLSDTMADVVAKLVTALSTVETDLADKVTPSEINVNSALSMNGSALTNAGSIQLMSGNAPTAGGSIYYSGGEFYLIDSTGVIQLTANGSLNAGSLGSIVGDYGGSNPALVSYDDTSGEFRFTEDTGVYADLVCDDIVLMGVNGSVRIGVDSAINTTRQIQIKSLPTSGVSFLVYNSATSTLEDGATTPVTSMSIATLTVTNPIKHGDISKKLPFFPSYTTGTFTLGGSPPWAMQVGSGTCVWSLPVPLEQGERLKSINVASVGTGPTITLKKYAAGVPGVSDSTTTGAVNTTITAPGTWADGDTYVIQASFTSSHGPLPYVTVTFDRP